MIKNRRQRSALHARIALVAAWMAACLAATSAASARQPFFDYGTHPDAERAFELPDIVISRVLYAELGCPSRPVWLTFQAKRGQTLSVQLGMPAIAALAGERPSLALVGPGLPRARGLPWEVPSGLGARIFTTEHVDAPRIFREPRLKTTSWNLLEQRIELPKSGRYYLVAWSPRGRRARLWVATGEEEKYGPSNVDDPLDRVKAFHRPWTAPDLGARCNRH
jgi:hypothetical protein